MTTQTGRVGTLLDAATNAEEVVVHSMLAACGIVETGGTIFRVDVVTLMVVVCVVIVVWVLCERLTETSGVCIASGDWQIFPLSELRLRDVGMIFTCTLCALAISPKYGHLQGGGKSKDSTVVDGAVVRILDVF